MPVIIGIVTGLWVLHIIIRSAIDGSQTADNIRYIRKVLEEQRSCSGTKENELKEIYEILNLSFDECPACHSKVSGSDKSCPSCGLALINKDND